MRLGNMNLGTRVWHQGGRQQPYLSAGRMKDITSIDSYHVIIDRVDGYQLWILSFLTNPYQTGQPFYHPTQPIIMFLPRNL